MPTLHCKLSSKSSASGQIRIFLPARGEKSVLQKARPIDYGLVKGGGDLFGWRPIVITQDMIGMTIAQVCNVEAKTSGTKTTKEQLNFHNYILNSGGFSKIVKSEEELP